VLLVAVLGVIIVAAHPQLFLFLAFSVYALSGPVRRLALRRREPAPPRVLPDARPGPGPSGAA
jgi:hypothetical protein